MNTKNLVITGIIAVVLALAAVQAFALPQYYGWGPGGMMMSAMNGHMNNSNTCQMMNGQGMMENMMNGQSMNHQQCQQRMGPNGAQMMNSQYHQQECQQLMGSNHNMTAEQCQAMYQSCHT